MVEIFDDRMEVSNPGLPLIDPLRFIDHAPRSRNEMLADLMRRLGVCEERGSGFDKVVFETEAFQLPAPDIRVDSTHTRVVLFGHQKLSEMDRKDKVRACYQHLLFSMFPTRERRIHPYVSDSRFEKRITPLHPGSFETRLTLISSIQKTQKASPKSTLAMCRSGPDSYVLVMCRIPPNVKNWLGF